MTYVLPNFKTKKALKAAVAAGETVDVFEPGFAPRHPSTDKAPYSGKVWLEGPHYPAPHTWYAQGIMENGQLKRISA